MKSIWHDLYDVLMPRFVTEQVALFDEPDGDLTYVGFDQLSPGEKFDAVCLVRYFNLFGFDLFLKIVPGSRKDVAHQTFVAGDDNGQN